jgi:L-ascorbate metabolism protein UlaG (beta-lactamase superfamily)
MKRICKIIAFLPLLLSCVNKDNSVQIVYYGHSCFEINYENTRILVDPFTPEWFDYELPVGKFNIGFSSHDAKDHSSFEGIDIDQIYYANGSIDEFLLKQGNNISKYKGIVNIDLGSKQLSFWTVPSFHDEVQGQRDGVNGILCLKFDGIKIVHLGDIGHVLEEDQIKKIGNVDVLMVPVDSYYIIDLEKAKAIVEQLSPTIILPIHYKTKLSNNNAYADDIDKFTNMFKRINRLDSTALTINHKSLAVESHLLLMDYMQKE